LFLVFCENFFQTQKNFVVRTKKMDSPAFSLLAAALPPYLVPTIDKYLRADIGRATRSQPLLLNNPKFVQVDGEVMTYSATPDGVLLAGQDGLVAKFDPREVWTDACELVPLSRKQFLVVGPTCVTLFDLDTGRAVNVVAPRERYAKLFACRDSKSTFIVADRDLTLYQYHDGKVYGLRRWPLRMHQVVADGLLDCSDRRGFFLAVRGNVVECYDIKSVPGLRSVTLEYRPRKVVAGARWILIAGDRHVDVYSKDLMFSHTVHTGAPITAMAELTDGCVVTGCRSGLRVWKKKTLFHTYDLGFTPSWMGVSEGLLVASDGSRLYTFH
jgi:hypothetical protein